MTSYVKNIAIISITILACNTPRHPSVPTIYSEFAKDSFEIYTDLPENYDYTNDYAVVFYMDANLKLGKEIREQIKREENKKKTEKLIFVGVGHIGSYRMKRRRDFIPPVLEKGDTIHEKDPGFGHADNFYRFLTLELIPYINKEYPNNKKYSYIGHSFSGLFAFYCLLKPKPVFKNYIALSPSLWANYNNIFEYEKTFYQQGYRPFGYLYHACGTGEWANKVLSTSEKMNQTIRQRNYQELDYEFVEHQGKNHNGVVPVSLSYIIKNCNF